MFRILLVCLTVAYTGAFVCPPNACATVRCAAVTAENCAGHIVENGGYCGCCDSCVATLEEGDTCSVSFLLGAPPASSVCNKGLFCDPATATCKSPIHLQQSKKQVTSPTCADTKSQIESANTHGLPLLGLFVPRCDSDGTYAAVQCRGSVCYCSSVDGHHITGYSASIGNTADMDCQCARDEFTYAQTGLIGKMFSCSSKGNYQKYQCSGSVCFCADSQGNMKPGSPTVNIGNMGDLNC